MMEFGATLNLSKRIWPDGMTRDLSRNALGRRRGEFDGSVHGP